MRTVVALELEGHFAAKYEEALRAVRWVEVRNATVVGTTTGLALSAYLVMMVAGTLPARPLPPLRKAVPPAVLPHRPPPSGRHPVRLLHPLKRDGGVRIRVCRRRDPLLRVRRRQHAGGRDAQHVVRAARPVRDELQLGGALRHRRLDAARRHTPWRRRVERTARRAEPHPPGGDGLRERRRLQRVRRRFLAAGVRQ